MTTIYRVETAMGAGMYRDGMLSSDESWEGSHGPHDPKHCPGPEEDAVLGKLFEHGEFYDLDWRPYYGFASISQAQLWIHPFWVKRMKDRGMHVSIYETDKFIHGDKQSVFDKKNARWVGGFPIDQLHDYQMELPL